MRPARLLDRMLRGETANVAFTDLVNLLQSLGFREIGGQGSHRIFARPGVAELINLQAAHGDAKPYQVRQVTKLVRQYALGLEEGL